LLLLTLPPLAILGCSLFYCSYRQYHLSIYLSTLKKSGGELERRLVIAKFHSLLLTLPLLAILGSLRIATMNLNLGPAFMLQAVGVGQQECLLNLICCYSPFRFVLFLVVLYFIAATEAVLSIYLL
jgi:hypothetical protein